MRLSHRRKVDCLHFSLIAEKKVGVLEHRTGFHYQNAAVPDRLFLTLHDAGVTMVDVTRSNLKRKNQRYFGVQLGVGRLGIGSET